jgi:hypothetical protein
MSMQFMLPGRSASPPPVRSKQIDVREEMATLSSLID